MTILEGQGLAAKTAARALSVAGAARKNEALEAIAQALLDRQEEILSANPNGVMLSNGPGDPAENVFQIEQIRKLLGKVPMFGICLGHQLTALAAGGSTYKLKYGHRGVNQPVRDLSGVRTYITSQNHGYAVDGDSLPAGKVRFINANDGTCEGID